MNKRLTTRKAPGTWVVRAAGAVIAESTEAVELSDGTLPPVIYFPRSDIATAFLEPSSLRSTTSLGEASYFSIVSQEQTLQNAAWSVEAPAENAEQIRGCIAFDSDKVAVEQL